MELRQQGVVLIAATNYLGQLEPAVTERLGAFIRELPPLTDEQRVELLKRTLPEGHRLKEEDVREVVAELQGGSIRLLQGLRAMIVNCARDGGGSRVPPTRTHVMEALEEARVTEEAKADAAAAASSAQSATTGARVAFA